MLSLNDFVTQKPRIMPIILLLDRSGSMSYDGKIESMNLALKTFLDSIKNDDNNRVELQVAIYSFGDNTATCDIPLTPIDMISPNDYVASGRTPLGHAFTMVKEMIEDKNIIPSRSYKPTIVVLTDGMPTDSFEQAMIDLVNDGRSSKAFRLAMAIGDDADKELLGKFVSQPEYLISGENARDIKRFFRFVTMSVTSRTKSQDPNNPPMFIMPNDDVLEF